MQSFVEITLGLPRYLQTAFERGAACIGSFVIW